MRRREPNYFSRLARAVTMRPPFTGLRKEDRAQAERDIAKTAAAAFDAGRRQGIAECVGPR